MKTKSGHATLTLSLLVSCLVAELAQSDIHFDQDSVSVEETSGQLTVTVLRDNPQGLGPASVDYATSDATATAWADYEPILGTLHFAAGEGTLNLSVPILNDALTEGPESLTITLNNARGTFLGQPMMLSVVIEDNDPGFRFQERTHTTTEDAGSVALTILRGDDGDFPATVDCRTVSGTAIPDEDYEAVLSTLTFVAGETSRTLIINILNDGRWEPGETLQCVLTDPTAGTDLGVPSSARIHIQDNDPGVSFDQPSYWITEDTGELLTTVHRGNDGNFSFIVDIEVMDASAVFGEDHGFELTTLEFAPEEASHTVSIPILNDGAREDLELFDLLLRNPSEGVTLDGRQWTTSVWIEDNDLGFRFLLPENSVAENGGEAMVTVLRGNDGEFPVEVDYATSDGTAQADVDYGAINGRLTFASGQATQTITVPILNDGLHEGRETFRLNLSNPSESTYLDNPMETWVTIEDNDPGIRFDRSSISVAENGAEVALIVHRGSDFDLTPFSVSLVSMDEDATAGEDYESVSEVLEFAEGEVERVIRVSILNDALHEGTETFTLALSNPSPGLNLGKPAVLRIRIEDNDLGFRFAVSDTWINEEDGECELVVLRGNDHDLSPASVGFSFNDVGATAGEDYESVGEALHFAADETEAVIRVPILNDALREGRESFTVSLDHPSAGLNLGEPALAMVAIHDNDPGLHFDQITYAAREDSGEVKLTVRRGNDGDLSPITVDVATSNLTATAGEDYAPVLETLSFAQDQEEQTLRLQLLDNAAEEPREFFNVALSNPSGALLGQPSVSTISIEPDDVRVTLGTLARLGGQSTVHCDDVYGVDASGDYAYVADGVSGLRVVDLTNPGTPLQVGRCETEGSAYAVAVQGEHVYVADGGSLVVINVSNPSQPQKVGSWRGATDARGVAVVGPYAYVADGEVGLQIIDVSTPSNPLRVGGSNTPGTARAIAVNDLYAYVADGIGGLRVINVSDPLQPQPVASWHLERNTSGVAVADDYVYLTSEEGLDIIRVSEPTEPMVLATVVFNDAAEVAIYSMHAYVTHEGGMAVIDVADPANPFWIGNFSTDAPASGVAISAPYALATDLALNDSKLYVIDISSPTNPHLASGPPGIQQIRDMAVAGETVFLASGSYGLQALQISDPTHPQLIGDPAGGYVDEVELAGDYAYTLGTDGWWASFQILDVANPAAPVRVGSHIPSGWLASDLAVVGDQVYIASIDGGLAVVDIADPANPLQVGSASIQTGSPVDVAAAGDYAYVAAAEAGLQIFDVSDPTNPRAAGRSETPGNAVAVAVQNDHVFVADGQTGLQVVDAANPADPTVVGDFRNGGARSLAVTGDYAFVGGPLGLDVLDITSPRQPRWVGGYDVQDVTMVAVSEQDVFLTVGGGQLTILRFTELPAFDSPRVSETGLTLRWKGATEGMILQRSPVLEDPIWQDVTDAVSSNIISIPIAEDRSFFRLIQLQRTP
jgi:hypothetical protein